MKKYLKKKERKTNLSIESYLRFAVELKKNSAWKRLMFSIREKLIQIIVCVGSKHSLKNRSSSLGLAECRGACYKRVAVSRLIQNDHGSVLKSYENKWRKQKIRFSSKFMFECPQKNSREGGLLDHSTGWKTKLPYFIAKNSPAITTVV